MMRLLVWVILIAGIFSFVSKPTEATVSKQVRDEYNRQLDTYRGIAREFEVKKLAYESAPTFANQENYVEAAKTWLVSRNAIWSKYFQILITTSSATEGLNEAQKQQILSKLGVEITELAQQSEAAQEAKTLDSVRQITQAVNDKHILFTQESYASLMLIKQGQLKFIAQALEQFRQQLLSLIDQQLLNPQVKEARLRGLEEVGRIIQQVEAAIADAEASAGLINQYDPAQGYKDWIVKATPLYQDLSQSYRMLRELSEGLEL